MPSIGMSISCIFKITKLGLYKPNICRNNNLAFKPLNSLHLRINSYGGLKLSLHIQIVLLHNYLIYRLLLFTLQY